LATTDPLPSWNDTGTRRAIVSFVEAVTGAGRDGYVPPAERVAVFDNDGTLWCEKPMPIELGFILQAFAGVDVEDYQADAHTFLHESRHPTLGRSFHQCGYRPMIELLQYLEANGFTSYIASGGDRDFMRPITETLYGIPSERVIGSSNGLRYAPDEHGGSIVYLAEPDVFDDGPVKPVRIWSRVGRRPILAAGNSNGDIPMLAFAGRPSRPGLRLLVLHDDPEREFDYVAGAERALEQAKEQGWTVISIKHDWATVFDDTNSQLEECRWP
jgi:hypothetical protein